MTKKMPVQVYIPAAEAVRRGHTRSGWVTLEVTEEQIASLSEELREVLASAPGLGQTGNPSTARAVTIEELRAKVDRYSATHEDRHIALPDPSWEMLCDWLRAILDRHKAIAAARAAWESEQQRKLRDELVAWQSECDELGLTMYSYRPRDERVDLDVDASQVEPRRPRCVSAERMDDIHTGDEILDDRVRRMWSEAKALAKAQNRRVEEIVALNKAKQQEAKELRKQQQAEAKKAWVETHGTDDMRERFSAGVLPDDELYLAVRRQLFEPLDGMPRYERIRYSDFESNGYDAPQSDEDVDYKVNGLEALSAEQWRMIKKIRGLAPENAEIEPRIHEATWEDQTIRRCSVRVSIDWHGRRLARVYALPSPALVDDED